MIARIKKLFKKRTEWEMMCPDYREYFLDCLLAYHSYLLMTGDWHSDIRAHFLKGFPRRSTMVHPRLGQPPVATLERLPGRLPEQGARQWSG